MFATLLSRSGPGPGPGPGRGRGRGRGPALLALSLVLAAGAAAAHDTWFEPLAAQRSTAAGARLLALGTGNQFPLHEVGVGANFLARHGCRRGDVALPLVALRNADAALVLLVPAPRPPVPSPVPAPGPATEVQSRPAVAAPVSCWAQLASAEIDLPPDKIELYLDEAQPPPAVREAWAAMRARGLPWRERYTKNARIELPGADPMAAIATAPSGMDMDVLLTAPRLPAAVGVELGFQVLRHGQPLPRFAVEFRNDRDGQGQWRRTDDQGRLRFAPALAGRWVLRGIDLRLSQTLPDQWEGQFVTLAFEVGARP